MVICAVTIALQPRRPVSHFPALVSTSAEFQAGASSRRFDRRTCQLLYLLSHTSKPRAFMQLQTFARRRLSKLFSFNQLRTLSVATGVWGSTVVYRSQCVAAKTPLQRTAAKAGRSVPRAYVHARSTTYNIGALPFIGAPSTAARLHPTWLLSFTQHPRGASAPAARMS